MLLLARSRTMSSLPLCIREARNKEPTQTEELMMANVHGAGINASTVFIGPKCFSTTTMTANPAIAAKGSKRRANDERARNPSLFAVHCTARYRRKALTANQRGTAAKIKAESKSENITPSTLLSAPCRTPFVYSTFEAVHPPAPLRATLTSVSHTP